MSAQRKTSVRELAHLICCAAAAHIASRSPFGAPPRHSPGRTHPPLAQLLHFVCADSPSACKWHSKERTVARFAKALQLGIGLGTISGAAC
jgi:hypothetical protein